MNGKKTIAVCLAAVLLAAMISGCGKGDKAGGETVKIYYSAMESGDYYEGWAEQLKDQAVACGAEFDVGYAENSVEMQNAQMKASASEGSSEVLVEQADGLMANSETVAKESEELTNSAKELEKHIGRFRV